MNGSPGLITAIDVADGTAKWAYGFSDTVRNFPALAGGLLFVGSGGVTGMYAFDGGTGAKQWSFQDADVTRDGANGCLEGPEERRRQGVATRRVIDGEAEDAIAGTLDQ